MTLELTRTQVLTFRRRVGALDERLPPGPDSLRRAAWAGLQDSMPRAALLSIHARVAGTEPSAWADPSLVQLWGPRYSVFVVAACDHAVFSLGILPDDEKGRRRAEDTAKSLAAALGDARMPYAEAGQKLGRHHNSLRYAAPTGTVLIRWEGARQPVIWAVPRPEVDPRTARLELARRYLHSYGPTTPEAFGRWAGIGPRAGIAAFAAAAKRRRVLPAPSGRPGSAGAGHRPPRRALDPTRLAGRAARRRRDRRHLAPCGPAGINPALAPAVTRGTRRRRGGSRVPAPPRPNRSPDHRPDDWVTGW